MSAFRLATSAWALRISLGASVPMAASFRLFSSRSSASLSDWRWTLRDLDQIDELPVGLLDRIDRLEEGVLEVVLGDVAVVPGDEDVLAARPQPKSLRSGWVKEKVRVLP